MMNGLHLEAKVDGATRHSASHFWGSVVNRVSRVGHNPHAVSEAVCIARRRPRSEDGKSKA